MNNDANDNIVQELYLEAQLNIMISYYVEYQMLNCKDI